MDKTKKRLVIIGYIFLAIVFSFGLKALFENINTNDSKLVFPEIEGKNISTIEVKTENLEQKIIKEGKNWKVKQGENYFPADKGRIENLIKAISTLKKGDIVSKNKERHKSMGIGDRFVKITHDGGTATVYVGNTTQTYKNFVKVDKSDNIFISENFNTTFMPEDYRDLTIPFVQNELDVSSVVSTSFGMVNELIQDREKKWMINGTKANASQVSFYLNELKTLRAKNVISQDPINGNFVAPDISIIVKEKDKEKKLEFYGKDEETMYAKRADGNVVYEVSRSLASSLVKGNDTLVEQEN